MWDQKKTRPETRIRKGFNQAASRRKLLGLQLQRISAAFARHTTKAYNFVYISIAAKPGCGCYGWFRSQSWKTSK